MEKYIVNGHFLRKARITGVQRFAIELLNELDKIVEPGIISIAIEKGTNAPDYKNIKIITVGSLRNHLWEQISYPLYALKKNYIPLNLCNASPILFPGVICIHDIKVKRHPEQFRLPFVMWYRIQYFLNIPRAKRILTVSEFSKHEICSAYHVEENKISVIYNAWNHFEKVKADNAIEKKLNLSPGNYFFYVGSMDPTKNMDWILGEAEHNSSEVFVITGAYNKRIFRFIEKHIPSNVIMTGFLKDEEIKALMSDCKAFLFPSTYEGFGIPPLEALSAGAPNLVLSGIDVLNEVYGEGFEYIDPHNNWMNLSHVNKADDAVRKGVLDKYSWKKSAEKLLYTLMSV